ncbi:hypothetical protein BFW01_g6642 [Lasiodiplodia theobromae]|uniref:Uncharacterized protein n=1 Tax=Lasiodiplodia theobromae TaxID=45133 RepID=A0A5N5DU07_9PEZI|nr:hypothetical protein DBV05_g695 [Lasiodiplodia theobromae]KAF9635747.1 hypothetical protein BFW01_g6642 [Lasiodiplodia theobromae]
MQILNLAILSLGTLASAAPTLLPRDVSATQYEISTLGTHFMGKNSGIADGSWPDSAKFNSTIQLTINYPANNGINGSKPESTTCTGSWINGTHPLGWNACENKDVGWKFTDFISEAKFTLVVGRITGEASADTGSVAIDSKAYASSDSWLICLSGAPFTGIHCDLNGVLSPQKGPIPVAVTSGPGIGPFH